MRGTAALYIAACGWVLSGGLALAEEQSLERIEASVNGAIILTSDVAEFRRTVGLRTQLDPLFAASPLAAKGAQASRADIVALLVDEQIILQEFPVTDAEVEQEISSIQANLRTDRAGLRQILAEQSFSFEQYSSQVRVGRANRDLLDRDIRNRVTVLDDDVAREYTQRTGSSPRGSTRYHVRILRIESANYKTLAGAREVAQRALQRLEQGEPFATVAQEMSDDGSRARGGELGALSERELNPMILSELKKLRIGQHSGVLADPRTGFFLLKLDDLSSGVDERFERSKEAIRSELAAGEYQRQRLLWLERKRQTSFIRINT